MASQYLNRRRKLSGRGNSPSSEKKASALSPTAFRQTLLRFSQRSARHDSQFCLIALTVLEYEEVLRAIGQEAANYLLNAVNALCLKSIRAADRLCAPAPGQILVLLPDATTDDALAVAERLICTIAAAKISHKHRALRASCTTRIASSAAHSADCQSMLSSIGCQLPDKNSHAQPVATVFSPFFGSLASWQARYRQEVPAGNSLFNYYKIHYYRCLDSWAASPVLMRRIELERVEQSSERVTSSGQASDNGTVYDTGLLSLVRRLQSLQSISHPGVCPLLDFHLEDKRSLYLVSPVIGDTLAQCLQSGNPERDLVCQWAMQICNILIYLQGMVPPVVPGPFGESSLVVNSSLQLVLCDFEMPYLFPHAPFSPSSEQSVGQPIAAVSPGSSYGETLRSFAHLLLKLLPDGDPVSQIFSKALARCASNTSASANAVFKIRSELKGMMGQACPAAQE